MLILEFAFKIEQNVVFNLSITTESLLRENSELSDFKKKMEDGFSKTLLPRLCKLFSRQYW